MGEELQLTEEELAAAIAAYNTFDVDRRGIRLCDLKQIYTAMGEVLRDEEMFNVRAAPLAARAPAPPLPPRAPRSHLAPSRRWPRPPQHR